MRVRHKQTGYEYEAEHQFLHGDQPYLVLLPTGRRVHEFPVVDRWSHYEPVPEARWVDVTAEAFPDHAVGREPDFCMPMPGRAEWRVALLNPLARDSGYRLRKVTFKNTVPREATRLSDAVIQDRPAFIIEREVS